jgi:hypothetical protein
MLEEKPDGRRKKDVSRCEKYVTAKVGAARRFDMLMTSKVIHQSDALPSLCGLHSNMWWLSCGRATDKQAMENE